MARAIFSDVHRIAVNIIVEARKTKGLTQSDLAAKIGRDQSIISHIERNQRGLDVAEFYEIAKALDVDPIKLFSDVVESVRGPT